MNANMFIILWKTNEEMETRETVDNRLNGQHAWVNAVSKKRARRTLY